MVGVKGRSGVCIWSEERRARQRENAKNNPNYGMKGKHFSKESKEKMKVSMSEESKQKLRKKIHKDLKVIHHINGNHFDNRPENKREMTLSEHTKLHIKQGDIKPYGGGRK